MDTELVLGIGLVALLVSGSIAILSLLWYQRASLQLHASHEKTMADAQHAFDVAMSYMQDVTKRAQFHAGLREGVNPHVLDPDHFGPSGMARQDEAEWASKRKRAQSVQEAAEDDELAQAEEHYVRTSGTEMGLMDEALNASRRSRPS